MHQNSLNLCRQFIDTYLHKESKKILHIADVGAADANGGTFKRLFNDPSWMYWGFDLIAGQDVNYIFKKPDDWQVDADLLHNFDVVISGNVLEHTERPWRFFEQLCTLVKPGGLIWLSAPNEWQYHPFPLDCWRIFPDGMKALFLDNKVQILECFMSGSDTVGIGQFLP